jgi:hypothetical protein
LLFFPGRFFVWRRPAVRATWGRLRLTCGRQDGYVVTQPGAFTLRVLCVRTVAARTLATAHLSRGQRQSARGGPEPCAHPAPEQGTDERLRSNGHRSISRRGNACARRRTSGPCTCGGIAEQDDHRADARDALLSPGAGRRTAHCLARRQCQAARCPARRQRTRQSLENGFTPLRNGTQSKSSVACVRRYLEANDGIVVSTSSVVLGAAAAYATHGSKLIDRVFAPQPASSPATRWGHALAQLRDGPRHYRRRPPL